MLRRTRQGYAGICDRLAASPGAKGKGKKGKGKGKGSGGGAAGKGSYGLLPWGAGVLGSAHAAPQDTTPPRSYSEASAATPGPLLTLGPLAAGAAATLRAFLL